MGDFGLAVQQTRVVEKEVGTPYYMAPEVIKGSYNCKADMWSVGVVMYWMFFSDFPFKGKNR